MQLVGVLFSPYVRRVAISLKCYGIPFEHYPLSSFGEDFATLKAINPVAKLPTLVLDNGDILMDSTLILEYFESQVSSMQKLLPNTSNELANHLRVIGLALMGCDKMAQLIYETKKRPEDKQYDEWINRVKEQICGAFAALEREMENHSFNMMDNGISQAAITATVAWSFSQEAMADLIVASDYPCLAAFANELEQQPIFKDTPISR